MIHNFNLLVNVLVSPYSLALFTVIDSILTLLFVQSILANPKSHKITRSIVCGIANGIIVYLLLQIPFTLENSFFLVLLAFLINIEILFFGSDRIMAHIYIIAVTVHAYACIYVFSLSLSSILFGTHGTPIHTHYATTLLLAHIFTAIFATMLIKFGNVIVLRIKILVHSWEYGMMLLYYNIIAGSIILFSALVLHPLMYPFMSMPITPMHIRMLYSLYEMFFSLLLLTCIILVIFLQYRLEENIKVESTIRKDLQYNTMINYSFNATKSTLDKKCTIFKKDLWEGTTDYFTMINNFIERCVHPDDKKELLIIASREFNWETHLTDIPVSTKVRCSLKKISEATELPENIKSIIASSPKEWAWSDIQCIATKDSLTGDIIIYVTIKDVDEAVSHESSLKQIARTDSLTGVYNRGATEYLIKKYLSHKNASGTLIMIDLDNFKNINDTLGHIKGDEVLKETSAVIKSIFRNSDIIGRLGGDEFCVFCEKLVDRNFLEKRCDELNKQAFHTYKTDNGNTVNLSLSIGVALCPEHGAIFEELYKCADMALYKSKNKGKNQYCFYAPNMQK